MEKPSEQLLHVKFDSEFSYVIILAMKIFALNTGGTLGMVGKPLRPAKSAKELMKGIRILPNIEITLEDCRKELKEVLEEN
jgi:hypothetical protein